MTTQSGEGGKQAASPNDQTDRLHPRGIELLVNCAECGSIINAELCVGDQAASAFSKQIFITVARCRCTVSNEDATAAHKAAEQIVAQMNADDGNIHLMEIEAIIVERCHRPAITTEEIRECVIRLMESDGSIESRWEYRSLRDHEDEFTVIIQDLLDGKYKEAS